MQLAVAIFGRLIQHAIRACLAAEHGVAKIEQEVSSYYLGDEIGGAWDGLMIALPPEFWTKEFGKLTTAELVVRLRELASQVSLKRFRKHPRGPKKPRPQRRSAKGSPHVSTAKLLARRIAPPTKAVSVARGCH